ncbi:flavin reductase family protein [Brachybacterium saurashtrense]|uniref:Flavin reductase n=1 Tax=Brachybacterium saurashtrense TaxID=556288 RepID=A0A345YP24_9MICO|nr:flavin reductase family protein [Brachybacterium saurashtrense]AXK45676.1 flavin reductase [Brachybacterium saurashtrense]RRR24693.1 flavin reductase [Brachybacterium saurashtrense]
MLTDTALREAYSHFPQGVVLVAAEVDGVRHGMVASTFTVGVSLEPPLVSLAVQHSSKTWPILQQHGHLGVTVLGRSHSAVTRQLASSDRERRFEGVDLRVDPLGALVLEDAPAWMTTRVYDSMRAGDHDVVLLEVLAIDSAPEAEAMVFHRSRFKELVREHLPA